ncbi:ABC transporter ATP-binding protein [Thioflexithrix psekupsensis]|uniref:Spermidine/putrescine import ATP-binding protein PotA n=1 Tax=Thioflexithrix psekupsensis TaxID=1570016 RepID=A0A251X7G7_9GAMM|nr:polyamine ABC transporter ATP-binding protein [Thioflexithrix psekupsensis]OUD14009.1 ABC transporter ATP-binding protein [Thioflexithrix psekupsensis]
MPEPSYNPTKPPTTDAKHYIEIEKVTKTFDRFLAVDNVSLVIPKGEIFALLGSSGSGKSTLLRMLAGFEKPSEGQIIIDGQDMSAIPPYERPVNMMFQSYALFPHLTVTQNVAFGLKQDKLPKDEIEQRVKELLELVHMSPYAKRKPHQLSGGQRQRVALARSLAKRPKLLLLDEPMGALDKKLRTRMQLEVVNILESVGVTCVMVTHDQEEAMTMAHRIGIMDRGRLLQTGTPSEIYETPNSRFTAEFIGSINIFDAEITEDEIDHAVLNVNELGCPIALDRAVNGQIGMQVWVGLRPEKILISKKAPADMINTTQGIVADIAYLGSHSTYHVKLASGRRVLITRPNLKRFVEDEEDITWDDAVYLRWSCSSVMVLSI